MDDVTELWSDDTDIAEWGGADFESRTVTVSIYDRWNVYRNACIQLSEQIGLTKSAMADYAMRVFLAECCDGDSMLDVRTQFDQVQCIPPKGWVDAHKSELPRGTVEIQTEEAESENKRMFSPQTAPVVREMIHVVVEEYDRFDGVSDYGQNAITYVVDGYEQSDSTLLERQ